MSDALQPALCVSAGIRRPANRRLHLAVVDVLEIIMKVGVGPGSCVGTSDNAALGDSKDAAIAEEAKSSQMRT